MRAARTIAVCLLGLGLILPWAANASSDDAEVQNLSAQLDQLSVDPVLGNLALGEQGRARDAITALVNSGRRERQHYLFIAQQRVELARAAAQVEADRQQLDKLQRERDHIMLEASQADADAARAELAKQRLQYQAAVEQAQMLQQQGAAYSQQAQQAQAEADQARKLASAQARAASLARKEADLAEAATKALRGNSGDATGAGTVATASLSLSDSAFQAGGETLTASRSRRLAAFAQAHAGQSIRIVPRAASGQRVLAGRRAVSVRDALVAGGADASRIHIRSVESGTGASIEVSTGP